MVKAALLMAEGFEEGETLIILDVLRHLGIDCSTVHFGNPLVKGMHGMHVLADRLFDDSILESDVLILPGGRPGGVNLRENPDVLEMVRSFNVQGKLIAAMCSGTLVLAEAGVIAGKCVTGYTGYGEKMTGATFLEQAAVFDQNLVTSQGPATPYPFAFKIAEALGIDTAEIRAKLFYDAAGGI